jgi:hypothetical protein
LDITLETQKFRIRNPLNQELHFCIENTLKLTYNHLEVKKISGGFAPSTPRKGREREGWGEEGQIGQGREAEKGGGERREGERRAGQGRNVAPPVKIP